MRDVESWIGFFGEVEERDGVTNFSGHYAAGLRMSSREQAIEPIQCVVFGRVRFRDQVRYRLRVTHLGESANDLEPLFEAEGIVDREPEVEGEWTFQLVLEISDLKFDHNFVILAQAWIEDEETAAHLKIATSTAELNMLTPLLR